MMHRFTYPAAEYDETHLDKLRILRLIEKHSGFANAKAKNEQYYEGKHKTASIAKGKQVTVTCNHAKDISDTATGYFMGNAITYSNTGDADIDPLLEAFDDADVDETDADNALDMSIFGLTYEYVYAAEGDAKPKTKNVSPLNTFIVVDDSIEERELFGVYYYLKKDDSRDLSRYVATVCTEHFIYEMEIDTALSNHLFAAEEPKPHNFGMVPIVEYLNNKYAIGDFEQQMSLIDAYDILMGDRVTDKEQFIDAILVLYGALLGDDEEETEEAQKDLRKNKLLQLPADAKAEYLSHQLDEDGVEVLRKAIKEDIYNFSHVPNLTDENFAGNSSGVAMEYKLLGLEMLTKTKERYYRKGLKKRIALFCNYLNLMAMQQDATSVIPTFSRSLPKNLQEIAQTLYNLKDLVSMETLLKQIPFVEDVDNEIQKVKEQKLESVQLQQELFAEGANNPPEDADDEDESEEDNDDKK
jgi:SPP1 family phage portal protein